MVVIIRQEEFKDYNQTFKVVESAFKEAEFTDGNEQFLVENLRKSDAFIPELSLVAEVDKKIVGHIMFTKINVKETILLALAPLSVIPEYQKQGIGGKLIKIGHDLAGNMGYKGIILVGHPGYYPRFGYIPADNFKIKLTFDAPREAFMALELKKGSLSGIEGEVIFPKEFGI